MLAVLPVAQWPLFSQIHPAMFSARRHTLCLQHDTRLQIQPTSYFGSQTLSRLVDSTTVELVLTLISCLLVHRSRLWPYLPLLGLS